jgi:chromosome segregation ATPase
MVKRRLDDELAKERHHRRKLEDKIDNLETELDCSRQSERLISHRVNAEVSARREVEGDLKQERARKKELERRLEARTAKPLFEDLANLFKNAANDEQSVALDTYCSLAGTRGRA